jgi:DNA-3-methyladenine glycosylase
MNPTELAAMLAGDVLAIAPRLLGMRITTTFDGLATEVMLDEVEAYVGEIDPASHSYRGETPRNRSMFQEAGTLYVYRSYGIHWCMNVVTGEVGVAHAVLLRGGRPVAGEEEMIRRRGRADHLADGPGKLTQALGVTGDHDGTSLLDGPVRLVPAEPPEGSRIVTTPRIGISKAVERPWRFVLETP